MLLKIRMIDFTTSGVAIYDKIWDYGKTQFPEKVLVANDNDITFAYLHCLKYIARYCDIAIYFDIMNLSLCYIYWTYIDI